MHQSTELSSRRSLLKQKAQILESKGSYLTMNPTRVYTKSMPLVVDGQGTDLCLWKDKKKSGMTVVIATLLWILLEIMETRFVPLACSIMLLFMLLLFLWAKLGQLFFTRRPPTPEEIKLADSSFRALFSKMEGLFLMMYEIAYGNDIKAFLWTIFYVVIIDTIGSYINLLTFLYICLVCSMTIPVLYLQFQVFIDDFIGKASEEKNKSLEVFKSKVVNKIPRATKMD